MLIDTHCHIHDPNYPLPIDGVLQHAHEAGVEKMVCVGTDVENSRQAVAFTAKYDHLFAAVGVHPHDAASGIDGIDVLAAGDVVAIGEIGLDYYYNNSPRQAQIAALEAQLQIACDHNLPVIFHVRSAFDDFWPVFENFRGTRGVLHSFTDTAETLQRALRHDLYIGVNGISTFTKDTVQQVMFQTIPLERLLFETDAPFLTPAPFRGKMNEPSMVREVAMQYAASRQLSFDEVAHHTTRNATQLFGI